MRKFHKGKKGFTLIEVLVVVAIIGVLATIISLAAMAAVKSSQTNAAKTKLTNYWKLGAQIIDQVNLGFTTIKSPDQLSSLFAIRINADSKNVIVSDTVCSSLSDEQVYFQYKYSPANKLHPYELKRITIVYKGQYYYTNDGKIVTGPKDKLPTS